MQGLMQDYPLVLPPLFERAERMYAGKPLISVRVDGIEEITVGQWARRTRLVAGALRTLGLAADARVASFAFNSANHLALYWGIPCTGRILHTLNVRLFPDQLRFIVRHAEDEAIFVDATLLDRLLPLVADAPSVHHIIVMPDGCLTERRDDPRIVGLSELLESSTEADLHVADENTAAAMCYTSGTTGHPKGVLYSHRSLYLHALGSMLAAAIDIRESDVVMPVVPMFHANGWGFAQTIVMAGASAIFPGPDSSPEALCRLIERYRVTLAAGVPTIWLAMLPHLGSYDLSCLHTMLCGGSAAPKALSERYREALGVPLLHAWGMTETSPLGSVCRLRAEELAAGTDEQADLRARQGSPVPGVEVRIVVPDTTDELPWDDEATGELQCRGPWIAAAYYRGDSQSDDGTAVGESNDGTPVAPDVPSMNSESFTADGWLRTGDVAAINATGSIRLVDRTKDLVKSGGEWISSVELENHLMSHPAVAEAAVIAVAHPRWGERPLACVVLVEGQHVEAADLIEHLRGRVATWWLPDDVVFIDSVPRTSVGKFAKTQLRDRFADYVWPSATG